MSEKELKPCPFCGGTVKKRTAPVYGTKMFICQKCGADVCFYDAEHEPKATNAWNARVITPDAVNKISQELQNAGFEEASKWIDCKYEV